MSVNCKKLFALIEWCFLMHIVITEVNVFIENVTRVVMSTTKKKRDEPTQPKKKPTSADDGDEDEAAEDTQKIVMEEVFVAYRQDRVNQASDLITLVTQMFESYLKPNPLENLHYIKKTLFPQMMARLQTRAVRYPGENSELNFVFDLTKEKTSFDIDAKLKFNTNLGIKDRLISEPNRVMIFSMTDLACLLAATRQVQLTLAKVSGRKSEETSRPLWARLDEELQTIRANTISSIRSSPGTLAWLKTSKLFYKGDPLANVVENLSKTVIAFAPANPTGGIVGIYFDFVDGSILTIKAEHIEVPSVRQLDEAYEEMRKHPTRVILLDMRNHYKSLRSMV